MKVAMLHHWKVQTEDVQFSTSRSFSSVECVEGIERWGVCMRPDLYDHEDLTLNHFN
jgi:hypothetical protein